MKKIVILILTIASFFLAEAQTITEKYWNYRQKFNEGHILRGIDDSPLGSTGGYSIPFVFRKTNGWDGSKSSLASFISTLNRENTVNLTDMPVIQSGDGGLNVGFYMSVLATEYYLLKNAGENTADLEQEIYEAFMALERLDTESESITKRKLKLELDCSNTFRSQNEAQTYLSLLKTK